MQTLRLSAEETENQTGPNRETRLVTQNFTKKSPHGFTGEVNQTPKQKSTPVLHKLLKETERRTSPYYESINSQSQTSKQGKYHTQ